MSDYNKTGGPAFPVFGGSDYAGMTLRDWFAGQALIGIMANNAVTDNPDAYARICFGIADAMVRESLR